MCQLIVKPIGAELPEDKYLKNSYEANTDGMGIGFYKQGDKGVTIFKGFKKYKTFKKFIKKYLTKEHLILFHFRMATAGKTDGGNTHPFPISSSIKELRALQGTYPYIVGHNGVFSHYSGHEKLSDTQKFISNVLTSPNIYKNLDDPSIQALLNGYLLGSKIAVLSGEGRYWLFGQFIEDNGVFYSNPCYNQSYFNMNVVTPTQSGVTRMEYDMPGYSYANSSQFCDVCLQEDFSYNMTDVSKDSDIYQAYICDRCLLVSKRGYKRHAP